MKRIALYGGAGLLGLGLLYVLVKKVAPAPGQTWAGTAGRAVATAAGDAATGAVKGVGAVFGIPETSMTQCQADLAAGRKWDASFSCPASTFIGAIFNSTPNVYNGVDVSNVYSGTGIGNAAMADLKAVERVDSLASDHYDEMGMYMGRW